MILTLLINILTHTTNRAMFGDGSMGNLDDLFKNIDFDKLSKDMESIFQEMGEKPDSYSSKQPAQAFTQEPSSSTQASPPAKEAQPKIIKRDRKSLFLDPLIIEQSKKNPYDRTATQATYHFPKIKEESYNYYLSKLINGLKSIEKKIDSSPIFSPIFKEEFVRYKKHIDNIVVADGIISHRRFYLRAFFLPQFNALREKIFNVIPALEQLDNRVTNVLKKEEKNIAGTSKLIEFTKKPSTKIQDALKASVAAYPRIMSGTRKGVQATDGDKNRQKHYIDILNYVLICIDCKLQTLLKS